MKKEEHELEQLCCKWARKNKMIAIKLEKNGHTGIPDRLFDNGIKNCYVEFKNTNGGVVSEEQKNFASFFKGRHFFIRDFDTFVYEMTNFFNL